jgi:phosphoglycolate phosphatase
MNRILIFDYDGVIIDSLPVVLKIFNKIGKKYHIRINNRDDLEQVFDTNFYEGLRRFGLKNNDFKEFMDEFEVELVNHQKEIRLFKGMTENLEKLSRNSKLVIVTSNLKNIVMDYLHKNEIMVFEEVLGAEKHVSKVQKIISIKEKYPDFEYFYIGDTIGDIIEGKEAKVNTVATTWGYHNRNKLEKQNPDFIVDSPDELTAIFESRQ